jgi:hypothetical protein
MFNRLICIEEISPIAGKNAGVNYEINIRLMERGEKKGKVFFAHAKDNVKTKHLFFHQ